MAISRRRQLQCSENLLLLTRYPQKDIGKWHHYCYFILYGAWERITHLPLEDDKKLRLRYIHIYSLFKHFVDIIVPYVFLSELSLPVNPHTHTEGVSSGARGHDGCGAARSPREGKAECFVSHPIMFYKYKYNATDFTLHYTVTKVLGVEVRRKIRNYSKVAR